jgi:hypothetical protein
MQYKTEIVFKTLQLHVSYNVHFKVNDAAYDIQYTELLIFTIFCLI